MKTVCAWCNKDLGDKPSTEYPDGLVSHGICAACLVFIKGSCKQSLIDYLDSLEVPVLVVNSNARIACVNKQAQEVLQKKMPAMEGQTGGDVFECAYAKLPAGCGKTIHCDGCTIRNTVMDTFNTGNSHLHTPAYLIQGAPDENQEIKFLISTEKFSDMVLLRIDKIGRH